MATPVPTSLQTYVNADFSRPAWLLAGEHAWLPSPQLGVERVLLDRIGAEKARATSLVRYAPGSCFPAHRHPGGEEILVLSGIFSADGEDHHAGTYLRNPPGSRHAPASPSGCLLLVKLWQMSPEEVRPVRVDSRDPRNWQGQGARRSCPLFEGFGEVVSLQKLAAGMPLFEKLPRSAELLIIEGALIAMLEGRRTRFPSGSWLRASGDEAGELLASVEAGDDGVVAFLKTGHLDGHPREWTGAKQ